MIETSCNAKKSHMKIKSFSDDEDYTILLVLPKNNNKKNSKRLLFPFKPKQNLKSRVAVSDPEGAWVLSGLVAQY